MIRITADGTLAVMATSIVGEHSQVYMRRNTQ